MAEFPKFEMSEINRGREQIIKVFRCTEYKTNNTKSKK